MHNQRWIYCQNCHNHKFGDKILHIDFVFCNSQFKKKLQMFAHMRYVFTMWQKLQL